MARQQRSLKQKVDSVLHAYLATLPVEDLSTYTPISGEPNAIQKSNLLTLREQIKEYLLSKGR